jgi:hypothetical protein
MRAPGDFQGALFAEAAMECVMAGADLSNKLDQIRVQEANMSPAMTSIWAAMKHAMNLTKLAQEVAAFNAANKYTKRGWYPRLS